MELTADIIRELLDYNSETGALTWRHRPMKWFAHCQIPSKEFARWNNCFAGKPALTADDGEGYRVGRILNIIVRAHRVAWLHYYGAWPAEQIDHINGDRADNRIENLRAADAFINMRNQKKFCTNTSGFTCVYWEPRKQRWAARLFINGKRKRFGTYRTREEAAHVVESKRAEFGFTDRHGK